VPVEEAPNSVSANLGVNFISLDMAAGRLATGKTPILLSTTFHPNWRSLGGEEITAATPLYMLTFTDRPLQLVYGRRGHELAALWLSVGALSLLFMFCIWEWRKNAGK
jgi:hypothetical protein